MSWVEANPGAIKQGIALDVVRWYQPSAIADTPASGSTKRVTIKVKTGANDTEIGHQLFEQGLIHSELAFQYWVIQAGREGELQAGDYDLSPSLTPSAIVAALRQEKGQELTIRIREGWRLEQIVSYLSTTNLTMNLDDFVGLVRDPPADLLAKYDFFANLPTSRSLEGYLFPDTYRVDANTTARALVEKLLDTFKARVAAIRVQIAKKTVSGRPMTLDQAVILASIVEREAVKASERPPIAAPGLASLTAVANANTATGYYYFVAACPGGKRDGSHYFAKTLAQQEANIAKANAECPAA